MDNVRVAAKDEEGNEIIVKTAKAIERGYPFFHYPNLHRNRLSIDGIDFYRLLNLPDSCRFKEFCQDLFLLWIVLVGDSAVNFNCLTRFVDDTNVY